MSEIDTGGPAYPTSNWTKAVSYSNGYSEGMTLRDYFAARALQGLLASTNTKNAQILATDAYTVADAMLKARNQ